MARMTAAELRDLLGQVSPATVVVVGHGDDSLEEFLPVGAVVPGVYDAQVRSFWRYPALETPARVRAVCLSPVL